MFVNSGFPYVLAAFCLVRCFVRRLSGYHVAATYKWEAMADGITSRPMPARAASTFRAARTSWF